MGGSGGGGWFSETSKSPEEIAKKIRDEEDKSKKDIFDTEVSNMIRNLLVNVNDRDTEVIQQHIKTITDAIHSEIDGTIDLRYGGSVSKHTYVNGLSDIDSLAILNNSELANSDPDTVKQYFYEKLKARLPNTDISIGNLAVTIKFKSGVEIQLLPAIKEGDGFKIPSSRRANEWSHVIRPGDFAKALRYANTKQNGKLVPVIKIVKSIMATFADSRQISGYHVEALAIEVFNKYDGEKTPKYMLKHFFSDGAKSVLNPIKDKSGQSVHVDDYLKESNSLQRKMVSDSLATVARKMQNADGSRDMRFWEQILK
jgi:Second Messenger Oligonucleotide or Dinucleotide Synthetase domain